MELEGKEKRKATIERPWEKYYTKEALTSKLPKDTIYHYLWENNKHYLEHVALNYFGKKITFKELFENIDIVAKSLVESGVKKGDIVTISMPSTPEAIYLFYALSKIGAIANMVDPRSSKEEIEHYIEETDSKLVFAIEVALPKFKDVKEKCGVEEVISVSPADSMPLGIQLGYQAKVFFENYKNKTPKFEISFSKWKEFYNLGKESNRNVEMIAYEENLPVVIVHTGGTTGVPKGVLLSNDNVNIAAFDCIQAGYDFKREHNWLNIMPPFIAYGIGNGLHLPLICGMETILIPQFDPKEFDKLLLKHKPNHMTGVPSHYQYLMNSKKLKGKDLSFIIAPTVGGSGMDIELEVEVNRFLREHNCSYQVVKGYGMSEVNAAVAACTSNECNALGSVGIPFPHSVIGIFNPDTGEELGYGEEGEIQILTPNKMLGYYNNPEEEEKVVKKHDDGNFWIHTGDLGYMDENGMLYIIGRIKNMIIRHDGFKVYPKRIEDAIRKHPNVESCMVIGIKDNEHVQGQLPKAFVKLKPGVIGFNIEAELEMLCKKLLPEYSQPVAFEARDSFPFTLIGKPDYHALEIEEQEKQKKKEKTKVYQLH